MNNPQIFDREGKKYEILQEGLVYDDANKSCIRPIGVKKNITIKAAIQKRLIREVSSNYIEIFAPQTEGNDVGTGANLLVLNESEMQVEVQPKILIAKKDNIYFMPVDQLRAQVFLAHGLIYPAIYDKAGLSTDFDDSQRQSPCELMLFATVQPINKNQLLLKILLHADEISSSAERTGNVIYLAYPLPISRLVGIEIPTTAGDLNRFIDGWIKPDVPVPRHLFSITATHSSADSEKVDLGVQQRSVAPILEVAESISKFDRYLGVMAFLRNADRYFSQRTGHYADFPEVFFSLCERVIGNLDRDSAVPDPLFLALLDIQEQSTLDWTQIPSLTQSKESYIEKEKARAIATEIYKRKGETDALAHAFKSLFNEDYRSAIELLQSPDLPDEAAILAVLFKFSGRQSNDHRTVKQRLHEDWSNSTRASLALSALGAYYGYTVLDARETSLYSVHPLIAPMIEGYPPIKFHLETLLERQIIEGFYQRAFFPEEPIRDASAFFAGIRTVSNSKHLGLPKLLVKDSSYAVRDLWVRQYDITLIGRIVQRLMAWNRESIDEQSQVGQYLFFKVSSDPSFEFKIFYKAGKQIFSYRIAKSKVIDLIKEGKIECDYKVLNLLLEKDLQHSQQ